MKTPKKKDQIATAFAPPVHPNQTPPSINNCKQSILATIYSKTLAVAEFLKWLSTTKQINLHATTNDVLRGISKHHALPIAEIETLHQEFFEPYITDLNQLHAQKIQLLANLPRKST
jgi:hypothetical protein